MNSEIGRAGNDGGGGLGAREALRDQVVGGFKVVGEDEGEDLPAQPEEIAAQLLRSCRVEYLPAHFEVTLVAFRVRVAL